MEKKFYLPDLDYEVTIGKFAQLSDGSVWIKQGGTAVLSTAVSQESEEFPGFLPLTVDYREQFSAAGKIPGGYYKREGKFSDKEILISRIIDRSIRPLFPSNYFNQIQLLSTVYSVDKEHVPHTLALIASSLALSISKIPFYGPVGIVEIARVNGEWIFNPLYSQMKMSDLKITVSGTKNGICMVEGSTNQISEKDFVDVLFIAHEYIKKQVIWQEEIQKQVGIEKEDIVEYFDFKEWRKKVEDYLTIDSILPLYTADKERRSKALNDLKEGFFNLNKDLLDESSVSKTFLDYVFKEVLERILTNYTIKNNRRIDNRTFDQVRNIQTDVGLLPYTHGSSLFQRGLTQALVSVTLGGGQDEQKIEDIMGETKESSFMLHYNFPPFAVGEVKAVRGPGRREIGHGYLADSAISPVLPNNDTFPYTIRVVADILSSDGSSSMATVCGSTMALMNAGVPITDMVSGVAMGLLMSDDGEFVVLTDIAGFEDAFGLMDFKVAGTLNGITAIQMDIKYKGGLSRDIFEKSLEKARIARLHILKEMSKVISTPNKLSSLVPQIISFKIPVDKIGAIIGAQGKNIKEIVNQTGTNIDIEANGTVKIFGYPGPKLDQACLWVKTLAGQIEIASRYTGKIKKIADFGIFVEIVPGQDGLVHISNMNKKLQSNFMTTMKLDEVVNVEVVDYDESTGRIRLKLI
jgi:polyribonucleotide nucleotidyltransferase